MAPWLRLAFGLCATLAIVGTALASTTLLLTLAGIAFLAAVFPVHPFNLIYNHGCPLRDRGRHLFPSGPPQSIRVRNWSAVADRNCGGVRVVADDCRLCSGIYAGPGVAILVSAMDICIPSMIFRAIFGPPLPRPAGLDASEDEVAKPPLNRRDRDRPVSMVSPKHPRRGTR